MLLDLQRQAHLKMYDADYPMLVAYEMLYECQLKIQELMLMLILRKLMMLLLLLWTLVAV